VRLPRLLQQLAVARGDGSYARILDRLQRLELLAIGDWLLAPLRDPEGRDLVEIIKDRSERASTLVASQIPAKDWHASIGDPNLADSICDRVLSNAHRIEPKGPSMRPTKGAPKDTSETKA
jgi:DNA replication protein DnaC